MLLKSVDSLSLSLIRRQTSGNDVVLCLPAFHVLRVEGSNLLVPLCQQAVPIYYCAQCNTNHTLTNERLFYCALVMI